MVGATVGKYRVGALIGEGGMGSVYRAQHTLIGKRVAIKVLRPELSANDEMVQRFFNEARAAARIDHPGIIDVYDFGRHDGRAYLVMELLDGEPLSARLARGPLAPDEARRIGRQIAAALAAAHDAAIAHRDLKPDNVFLARDEAAVGGERVKLLDFGIAKLTEADGTSSVETRTGAVMGTPVYMSPEQCRGTGEVDHRTDLYALGCILYEMLSGRPPFVARGAGELISAHLTEHPRPLAQAAPRAPAPMATLVDRLLAKTPGNRLQHARDVVAALDGELEVAPLGAAPAPAAHLETLLPDDDAELARAHTMASDAGVKPAANPPSTLTAAAAERANQTTPDARPGRGRWLTIGGVAALVAGAALTFGLGHGGGEPVVAVATDAGPSLRQPRIGLRQLDGFRAASGSGITIYTQAGSWESARDDFAAAAAQPGAPAHWSTAATLCDGMAQMASGHAADALVSMRRAADAEPDWVMAQLGLSAALSETGDHDGAVAAARHAERLAPDWWVPIATIANAHRKADRFDDAVEAYKRALALAPNEPLLVADLALMYHVMHLDQQAEEQAQHALELDPALLGVHIILAERALEKGDGKSALEHAEKLLAGQPKSAAGTLAQADALVLLGRNDAARVAYQRALDLARELEQDGAPPERMKDVINALAHGALPRPRSQEPTAGRTRSKAAKAKPHREGPARDRSKRMRNDPLGGLDSL